MIKNFIFIFSIGAGLLACSSVNTISVDSDSVPITAKYEEKNKIDSIIGPYRVEMEDEMLEVIAQAENDFTKGRPNAPLNNWCADAILNSQLIEKKADLPVLCLLNVGGLRSPINKGLITLGDIFKLMPFDNEIVWVLMPASSIYDIEEYLSKSGGEPIAGLEMNAGKFSLNDSLASESAFWVLTSDYLFNGGDHMDFFQKKLKVELTGVLMRDAMIMEAKRQEVLVWNNDNRINL